MNVKKLSATIIDRARQGDDILTILRAVDEFYAADPSLALEAARRWAQKTATDAVAYVTKPAGKSSRAIARNGQPPLPLMFWPALEGMKAHEKRIRSRKNIVKRQNVDEAAWVYVQSWRSVHDDAEVPAILYHEFLAQIGCPKELIEALAA